MTRRQLLCGVAAISFTKYCGVTKASIHGSSVLAWHQFLLGAGGYCTEMVAADDGTLYTRSDVQPGWVKGPAETAWTPLFTPANFDTATYGQMETGIWDICCAPTDSNTAYAVVQANKANVITYYVFKTIDRGVSWTAQAAPGFPTYTTATLADPNSVAKFIFPKSAIDPANKNHVLIWYPSNSGLYESFDGGATASVIGNGLPVGQAGSSFPGGTIVFDRASGTTTRGGHTCTATLYAGVWGGGQWKSADGGATWTNISAAIAETDITYTTAHANSIFVVHIEVFGGTVSSVTDSIGLTWTKRAGPIFNSAANANLYEYTATAAVAQAYTIKVNCTNGTTTCRVGVSAWTGVTGFDSGVPTTSTTAAPLGSTAGTNRVVLAFTKNFATGADAGYTVLNSDGPSKSFFSEYQVFAAQQTNIQPQGAGATATAGIFDALVETGSGTGALDGTPSGVIETTSAGGPANCFSMSCTSWTTGAYLTKRLTVGEKNLSGLGTNTKTWQYNDDGTWTEVKWDSTGTPTSFECWASCPDPNTPGRIWFQGNACGTAIETLDNCTTNPLTLGEWSGNINVPAASGGNVWAFDSVDIGWLGINVNVGGGTQGAPIEFSGNALFDPIIANKLWQPCGTGVRWINPPSTFAAFRTSVQGLGIEQLITTFGGKSIPGSISFCGVDDRGFLPLDPASRSTPPAFYVSQGHAADLTGGYGFDYASSDSNFVVAACSQQAGYTGYSTTGGKTAASWTTATKNPVGADVFPNVAVASPTNWVMTNINGDAWNNGIGPGGTNLAAGVPIYTTDQSGTWNTCQLAGGGGNLPSTGWSSSGGVWADRALIGTFYLVNHLHGLYRSTDDGATWTLLTTVGLSFTRAIDGTGKGKCFPGTSIQYYTTVAFSGDILWISSDGVNWSAFSALVTSVVDFDFGAGGAVIVVGTVNGHFGVSFSFNSGVSWSLIGSGSTAQLVQALSFIKTVIGDGVNVGACWLGYEAGIVYYGH